METLDDFSQEPQKWDLQTPSTAHISKDHLYKLYLFSVMKCINTSIFFLPYKTE